MTNTTAPTAEIRTHSDVCYRKLANLIQARQNCVHTDNKLWAARHRANADQLVEDCLPSGSGVDAGTTLDWEKSTGDRLVFTVAYHHMDDGGGYCGWSAHQVIVTADLMFGISVRVTGKDRDGIKEYLGELYQKVLARRVTQIYNVAEDSSTFVLDLPSR